MKTKALKLKCYFCGGSLKTNDSWFEIYDQEMKPFHGKPGVRFNEHGGKELHGSLTYPGNGEAIVLDGRWSGFSRVVLFTHTKCGPDCGYPFSFDRLGEDWDRHLQGKVWWSGAIAEALETARKSMKAATKK
jgi:hypothetical protein